jgi:hypothetical protein
MRTEVVPRLEQRHTDLAHGLSTVLDREADGYKGGRCGRERPAEVGGGGPKGRRQGGAFFPRNEIVLG